MRVPLSMQRLASLLVTLPVVLALGCARQHAPAPAPAAPAPTLSRAAAAPSASPVPGELGPKLAKTIAPAPASLRSAKPIDPGETAAPVARPACVVSGGSKEPAGFYRTDEWRKGEVVLTFDDGPHPSMTPKVLDLLRRYRMPATFFLVGAAIRPDTFLLVQRMVAEGHSLGSHTYNHDVGMSVRNYGERSIQYIRGQHETTQLLIELALIAESRADFEAIYRRVIDAEPGRYLPARSLRTEWRARAKRHRELLDERGYADGKRPYAIVYSRPPAGTPYVGLSTPDQVSLYTSALSRLGWLNVMWHGGSGDTDPARKRDYGFLTANLRRQSRRGGVVLIHDYMRRDALAAALDRMASDPAIRVVPIETAVRRKFGCDPQALRKKLQAG